MPPLNMHDVPYKGMLRITSLYKEAVWRKWSLYKSTFRTLRVIRNTSMSQGK